MNMSSHKKTYSMPLMELLSVLSELRCQDDVQVEQLSMDSRNVTAGTLFIAYPGQDSDGRLYLQQAVSAGAVAVLYEAEDAENIAIEKAEVPCFAVQDLQQKIGYLAAHFYQYPSHDLQVFGVTGTNGKTSCCYFLTQAFSCLGLQSKMIGTIGEGSVAKLKNTQQTTPDPISLQKILANWRDEGVTQVSMEVSSHALVQGRVNGVRFYACLFTNLSHDHLDYHQTMQAYAQAKKQLFEVFPSQLVISNLGDELGEEIIEIANSEFVVSYANSEQAQHADVYCKRVLATQTGLELDIKAGDLMMSVSNSLIGNINVPNILLVVACLLSVGIEQEQIKDIIAELNCAPGRMELFDFHQQRLKIVVDYAHTPDALEKALQAIQEHCHAKVWCVFGCGGDRDKSKRTLMGEVANRYADYCVVTNDNPRTESAEEIVKQVSAHISEKKLTVLLQRDEAIRYAIKQAKAEDWILVAGRGHETLQKFADKTIEFSDRHYVATLIEAAA